MTTPVLDRHLGVLLPLPERSRSGNRNRQQRSQSTQTALAPEADLDHQPAAVKSLLPRIGVSRRTLRKLEAIQLVRDQRDSRTQEVSYHARPFVLCGLPLRRPPATQQVHRRRNGKFLLHIVSHPDYGLPTVRADCTCSQFGSGMGRDSSSLPPIAGAAIRSSQEKAQSRRRYAHSPRIGAWHAQHSARVDRLG